MIQRLAFALCALGGAGTTLVSLLPGTSPWPWVAITVLGVSLVAVDALAPILEARAESMRQARELADKASVELNRHTVRLEGTLSREESVEMRAGWNAMVLRMQELEAHVETIAREQRARDAAAPFAEE